MNEKKKVKKYSLRICIISIHKFSMDKVENQTEWSDSGFSNTYCVLCGKLNECWGKFDLSDTWKSFHVPTLVSLYKQECFKV